MATNGDTVYAEVIYETGAKSVARVDDMEAFKAALLEHDKRARTGVPGGPDGHAGERIKRVLLYKQHPGDTSDDGVVNTADVLAAVSELSPNGDKIVVWDLITELRRMLSPLTDRGSTGPHDSVYKMKEYDELAVDWLDFDPRRNADAVKEGA